MDDVTDLKFDIENANDEKVTLSVQRMRPIYVYQDNEFVRKTIWGELKPLEQKVFKVFIAFIDSRNPPKDGTVYINKKALHDIIGNNFNDYGALHEAADSLSLIRLVMKTGTGKRSRSIAMIVTCDWDDESNMIKVQFHNDLLPYITNLSTYTSYEVSQVRYLRHRASIPLYDFLHSYLSVGHPFEVSFDDLRWITKTQSTYKRTNNFINKVLKPVVEEINNSPLDYSVSYKLIRKEYERKAVRVRFTLTPKTEEDLLPALSVSQDVLKDAERYWEEYPEGPNKLNKQRTIKAFIKAANEYESFQTEVFRALDIYAGYFQKQPLKNSRYMYAPYTFIEKEIYKNVEKALKYVKAPNQELSVLDMPEYIRRQIEDDLPDGTPASKETLEKAKRLQQELREKYEKNCE